MRRVRRLTLAFGAASLALSVAVTLAYINSPRPIVGLSWPGSFPALSRVWLVGDVHPFVRTVSSGLEVDGGGMGVRLTMNLDEAACHRIELLQPGACDSEIIAHRLRLHGAEANIDTDVVAEPYARARLRIGSDGGRTIDRVGLWFDGPPVEADQVAIDVSLRGPATLQLDDTIFDVGIGSARAVVISVPAYYYGHSPHDPIPIERDDFALTGLSYINEGLALESNEISVQAPGVLLNVGASQHQLAGLDEVVVVPAQPPAAIGISIKNGDAIVVRVGPAAAVSFDGVSLMPTLAESEPLLMQFLFLLLGASLALWVERAASGLEGTS